jgi:hypothetical protein
MPMYKVVVTEYDCVKCGHKWINRVNGVDGPIPQRCSRCKRSNWNRGSPTPKEIGLRRRVHGLKTLYEYQSLALWYEKIHWPEGLSEKFLDLGPPPRLEELERVLSAPVLKLNSQNQYSWRGWVPDPNQTGCMKYDPREYKKLFKEGAQQQQDLMQEIIDSRPC